MWWREEGRKKEGRRKEEERGQRGRRVDKGPADDKLGLGTMTNICEGEGVSVSGQGQLMKRRICNTLRCRDGKECLRGQSVFRVPTHATGLRHEWVRYPEEFNLR